MKLIVNTFIILHLIFSIIFGESTSSITYVGFDNNPLNYLPVSYIKNEEQLLTNESLPDEMFASREAIYELMKDAPTVDTLNKIDTSVMYTPDSDQRDDNFYVSYIKSIASNGDWDFFPVKIKYEKYILENQPDKLEWNDYFKKQIETPAYLNGTPSTDVTYTAPVVITESWTFDWDGVETSVVTASNVILTGDDENLYKQGDTPVTPNPPPDDNTVMYTISAIFTSGHEPKLMYSYYQSTSYVPLDNFPFSYAQYISAVQNDKNGELMLCPVFSYDVAGDAADFNLLYRPVYLLCDIDGDSQAELIQYDAGFDSLTTNYSVFKLKNGELTSDFGFTLG